MPDIFRAIKYGDLDQGRDNSYSYYLKDKLKTKQSYDQYIKNVTKAYMDYENTLDSFVKSISGKKGKATPSQIYETGLKITEKLDKDLGSEYNW